MRGDLIGKQEYIGNKIDLQTNAFHWSISGNDITLFNYDSTRKTMCEFGTRQTISYSFARKGVVEGFPEVYSMETDHESEQNPDDVEADCPPPKDMRQGAEEMRQTAREMRKGVVQTSKEMHTMRDSLRREKNSYDRSSS